MKKILLTAISFIFILTVKTQIVCSCLPDGIYFSSQEKIDSFQQDYPGCTMIEGNVTIAYDPWKGSEITNLNGLSLLNSIGGDLQIGNWWSQGFHFGQKLTSLEGLENLISVEGSLHIYSNPSLASYPAGMYYVQLQTGDKVLTEKVVKY